MNTFIQLLAKLNIHPVLIDIGASAGTPEIWTSIANQSIYVGFDPDRREVHEPKEGLFYKSIIVNKAITSDAGSNEVLFNLTKFPQCSSILKPDTESVSEFLFSDYFIIEREAKVKAITLDTVIDEFSLNQVYWIKTDTQGTDLRIFNSLSDKNKSRVLAIDVEPGLVDVYQGEDLFVDIHQNLVKQGFWLSDLKVCGTTRLKKSTLQKLSQIAPELDSESISRYHKETPCWCEARYLRKLNWLEQNSFDKEKYIMLWIFSQLDNQIGFAAEVALEYERLFGKDLISQFLINQAISRLKSINHGKLIMRNVFGKVVPKELKQWVRKIIA
ncbi:MAG: FkbM family methyltransferase [Calothrix sp. C42_A2020_038]|nr:FkbM family methyltransferase [Calothrix sp. C42_A2020_038]